MRIAIAIAILAALPGCGRNGYENADGTFNRDLFKSDTASACRVGALLNEELRGVDIVWLCNCLGERAVAGRTDDELRAHFKSDAAPAERQAIAQRCADEAPPARS